MALNTGPLLSFLLLAFTAVTAADDYCVYTMFVRTGSIIKAGTDSIISVRLYDDTGEYIEFPNLAQWGGLMGAGHSYYERGNLDIFSGRAPCLSSPPCALNVTSDGAGKHHGWYVNYVEVNTAGVHAVCTQQKFEIEQWLADDVSPYELTAIRNNCPYSNRIGRKDGVGVRSAAFI